MSIVINREQIYAALFTKLQGVQSAGAALTVSRHVKHYGDVPIEQRPAVFQFQKGEQWKRLRGFPPVITLKAEWLAYIAANPDDPTTVSSTAINNLIDAVENALAPSPVAPNNNQDLGLPDVVQHAWIEDGVEVYEGVLLDTSIVIIPIHILCSGGVPA
jgi:hypothetical protein